VTPHEVLASALASLLLQNQLQKSDHGMISWTAEILSVDCCSIVLGTHPSGIEVWKRTTYPDPEVYLKGATKNNDSSYKIIEMCTRDYTFGL
jgi:hypothetical protein